MEPFYFGEPGKKVFGVYHPAARTPARECGVVLCYPAGSEYMRAHRAFRQLARRLSEEGFHVLRFDYSGTGDSEGEMEDSSFRPWLRDINAAADELREGSEISSLSLVGLRLGASLAALAAAERRDIRRLVLWDPIVSGPDHLEELDAFQQSWLRGSFARERKGKTAAPGEVSKEILGFPIGPALLADLAGFQLSAIAVRPAPALLWIESTAGASTDSPIQRLRELGARIEHRSLPAAPVWVKIKEGDEFGGGLVPGEIVNAIVDWLSEEDR